MSNKEIYKKTLVFSVRRLLVDFLGILLLVALCGAGFLILDKTTGKGLIGLGIGLVMGIIVLSLLSRFVSYVLKAGQIAMMTKGVTEGRLPDNVYEEGKAIVKRRFLTVAALFAATKVIKGIFNQIGRVITAVGNSIGGEAGGSVGSAISAVVQTIVSYLCDCCLGWVFFREGQNAAKATCEGAVLFFKHGKTFIKNMGRVFGMGLVSLLAIGGAFFGISYGIFLLIPNVFDTLAKEIVEAGVRLETEIPAVLSDPKTLMLICAAIIGVMIWSIIHSAFVRPFILTGVLRNYIMSGVNDVPAESDFAALDAKSRKFAKLHGELG
ncbi:MAG: hypothetical protein IJR90_05435 [Clostridia bacterium]|nr:hypothetical protein [Clostridia bacterium]